MDIEVLRNLIKELLDDPPVNNCADNGTTCVFCEAYYSYINAHFGKPVVTHAPYCWLVRAAAAHKTPTRVVVSEEWDGYAWTSAGLFGTFDAAKDDWRERVRGVEFRCDPKDDSRLEVWQDGMRVGGIWMQDVRNNK